MQKEKRRTGKKYVTMLVAKPPGYFFMPFTPGSSGGVQISDLDLGLNSASVQYSQQGLVGILGKDLTSLTLIFFMGKISVVIVSPT